MPCVFRRNSQKFRLMMAGIVLFTISWTSGCATTTYQFGRFHPGEPGGVAIEPVVVHYGEPNKTVDRIGWVVGMPARLLTMNKNVNNHHISPETLDKLKTYLEQNDITDVYVSVDRYEPKDQWARLHANQRISPFWKYSAGSVTVLGYTLLPNRIFGGDRYNPFTNTLNLSSDVPAMVLAEAAYAKDIHGQQNPGAYAALVNDLPGLTVVRQARATSDVLGYARLHKDWPVEKQAYHVLYPQMGVSSIGTAGAFVPVVGPYMDLGGALIGHAAGRTVAAVRDSQVRKANAAPAPPDIPNSPEENSPGDEGGSEEIAQRQPPKSREARVRPMTASGVVQAGYEVESAQQADD